jgi:phospholipid transport system substrate-binding protein
VRLIPVLRAGLVACLLSAGVAAHAADDPAVVSVRTLYGSFETALKAGPGDVRTRATAIGPTLAETMDFPAMVRIAVGPKWQGFTPEQQAALTEAFGRYFTATYATRLAQAAGGTFSVKSETEARGANRLVQSEATNAEGDSSQVDYLVGPSGRIQDVYLNGDVSEVATLRGSFADPLKSGGADELLKFLRERTAGMLAAKPAP